MKDYGKWAVVPYESLIDFANVEEVTAANYRAILQNLRQKPHPHKGPWPTDPAGQERASRKSEMLYKGMGFPVPWQETMNGPDLLRTLQQEFKGVLGKLTEQKDQDVTWLLGRIVEATGGKEGIRMQLSPDNPGHGSGDFRILSTDPVRFIPIFTKPRQFVYFRLGKLWENGLLHRIGRCQNPKCPRFFLGKTKALKEYCSQRCAQNPTAAKRTNDTRARRGAWESVRADLERALQTQSLQGLERAFTKAQQAFAEAYRRQEGPGYKEGKSLLARAMKQLRQLR